MYRVFVTSMPACMCNADNNSSKKSNDEDGKSDAKEEIWNVGYDNGDNEDYDKSKLREGQQLFLKDEAEASCTGRACMYVQYRAP